ncbi:unnamed protein product [Rhizophagus irregularis]|nr:unnamed protein product [Rhizophagus irregularis]
MRNGYHFQGLRKAYKLSNPDTEGTTGYHPAHQLMVAHVITDSLELPESPESSELSESSESSEDRTELSFGE